MTVSLLTVAEVARWLNVSQSWVREHATGRRRPALPALKMGKALRFEPQAVERFIRELAEQAQDWVA